MKRFSLSLTICVGVLLAASGVVHAFRAPELTPLPNIDRRFAAGSISAAVPPERQAAAARLRELNSGVEVDFHPVFTSPRFIRSRTGFLTGPNGTGLTLRGPASASAGNDSVAVVRAFLNEHSALFGHDASVLANARIKRDYVTAHNGLRTVVWEQQLDGVTVLDSVLIGHVSRQGELISLSSQFLRDLAGSANLGTPNRQGKLASPPISARDAMVTSAWHLGESLTVADLTPVGEAKPGPEQLQRFRASVGLNGESHALLTWIPLTASTLRLAWDVTLTSKARGEMFRCIVDAQSGELIIRRNLTAYISDATYRVYLGDSPTPFTPGHPTPNPAQAPFVNRVTVVTNAYNTNASPLGWINDGDNETLGNNVEAHLDANNDDLPDLPRPQGNPTREFVFPMDFTMPPSVSSDAAVVNLFFRNNWIHDKLWELGFTEAAGNFQSTNFNRGGLEDDPVVSDAQDSGGFNNANMATPQDGFSPRMQMYLFDVPDPDRDGSLDNQVIIHEYCHGLSNRLLGGGVGITESQTAGMGEGWGDFFALALLSEESDDPGATYPMGAFAFFQLVTENHYFGLRRYPYTVDMNKNPFTFKDIDPVQASSHPGIPVNDGGAPANEVHNQGEVWCVTLWDVRHNLVAKHGFTNGNQLAMQLVVDGMKLSPANPNFLEARDAIILADQVDNGGANFNELWAAFAKRGMGGSATSPSSSTTEGVEEAFDLPGLTLRQARATDFVTGNGNGTIDPNECTELEITLLNIGLLTAHGVSASLSSTTPGVSVSQSESGYPDIPRNGLATNLTPFKIYTAPNLSCGQAIEFVLLVTSDQGLRTNRFMLDTGRVGEAIRYDSGAPAAIPDGNFFGVEVPINVSGFSSLVGKVTVSLHIQHPFPFDLDMQLIAPDGRQIDLVTFPYFGGLFGANFGTACNPETQRTTFDDKASVSIASSLPPNVGTFRPQQALSAFNARGGNAVNGIWKLRVRDSFFVDTGTVQCWSLFLSPNECSDGGGECSADIAVRMTNAPSTGVVGSNLTYTVTVTNLGVNLASAISLVDTLPPGVTFISANSSQGGCNPSGGGVSCNLGNIGGHGAATVNIVVRPNTAGSITNRVTVLTAGLDPDSANNTAVNITTVESPSPVIVPAGATLIAGDDAPANGGIDPGERVTLSLALRNIGRLPATNLLATLLATNGVTLPDGPQIYGLLPPGGNPVSRQFTFTADGTNNGFITVVLALNDGTNLGQATFTFGLSSESSWGNPGIVATPDQGPAGLYPSPIIVEGVNGLVQKVTVSFTNFSHTYPIDMDALLVSPRGQRVMLLSDAGGSVNATAAILTFDDAAESSVPRTSLAAGTYRPTDYEPGDVLPSPAPSGTAATNLAAFSGSNPNGTWLLYVADDTQGDRGRISGGWSLSIAAVDPVSPDADLAVSMASAGGTGFVGSNITYTISVTNSGPETASDVVLSNALPVGIRFVSASTARGSCTESNGAVRCALGALTNQTAATVTIVGQALTAGPLTLEATVTAATLDFRPENNRSSLTTSVAGVADLSLSLSASPSPVFVQNILTVLVQVTNRGPNHAQSVLLTNNLPAGVTFISATPSQGSCSQSGSRVLCNLGALPNLARASVTIQMRTPAAVGALIQDASVGLISPSDLDLRNNRVVTTNGNVNPAFVIAAVGTTLDAESLPSGGIDVGEQVTISFALRNLGTSATTNLLATLLPSNGVTNPSAPQNYGVLEPSGPSVARAFSFTAQGTNGGVLVATLQLNEGDINLGTIDFSFALGSSAIYGQGFNITLPDSGRASVYPIAISIVGLNGTVSRVTATLTNLSHSYPDDLDILLVGPAGHAVLLMSDAGGGTPINGATITFSDSASGQLPDVGAILSGLYRPTNFDLNEAFPSPAPSGPYDTNLFAFVGSNPNGAWLLYIMDDSPGDAGRIAGGFGLSLTTVGAVSGGGVPASLGVPVVTDGRVEFSVFGTPGQTYVLEASTNLQDWLPISTNVLTFGEITYEENIGPPSRFYRAVRP